MHTDNSIQNAVYNELKKGILSLQLLPGTEMSTQEMATTLQVSRTPVREAFLRLQREGLVVSLAHKGTMVSKINLNRVTQERFLREALELAAVDPFLEKATDADFHQLYENIEKQKAYFSCRNYAEFVQYDDLYHKKLFEIAGQALCWEIITNYNGHYNRIRVLSVQNEDTFSNAITQHETILHLMERKNAEAVRKEIANHVQKLLYEKESLLLKYPDYFTSEDETVNILQIGSLCN